MNESIIETKLEQSCIRRFFNIIHMIYLYKEWILSHIGKIDIESDFYLTSK